MSTYIIRAAKYFFRLIILLVILFALMYLTNTAQNAAEGSLMDALFTDRGILLAVAVVALSILYPYYGYITRNSAARLDADRDKILKAMVKSGFEIEHDNHNNIVFRKASPIQRALTLWEDRVTVAVTDNGVAISGLRKEVVRIEFRLNAYLQTGNDE